MIRVSLGWALVAVTAGALAGLHFAKHEWLWASMGVAEVAMLLHIGQLAAERTERERGDQ